MENEERWEAEANRLDIRNRIRNLMWTVSQDYELDIEVDQEAWQKSKYIAFYDAVREGGFARYFNVEEYEAYITKRVYAGWEPSVLLALGRLCIDCAVYKKLEKERRGVASIRRRAMRDTLEKDGMRLTHTDWGHVEACYLRFILDGTEADERNQGLIRLIGTLEDAERTSQITDCLSAVYERAYAKGFTKKFKGLSQELMDSGEENKEYTDKEYLEEESEESQDEHKVNLFTDELMEEEDLVSRYKANVIVLDEESSSRMEEYVERNYGKSYLTAQEQKHQNSQICRGNHEDSRLHFTDGLLHGDLQESAKAEYVKKVRDENLKVLNLNQMVTRQNVQMLANTLKRALLTRNEKEVVSSEYGNICARKLWNLGRTDNRRLFEREIIRDNTDFVVEVLIDASGSQQGRQALVALQGYIISEALSIVRIPQRVMGFCTFGDFTIMQRFRDYEDDRAANERIFEFYGSANNRDGLAVRAAADSLEKRKEENKILIVLSDGRPNDVIAGSLRDRKKEAYCTEFAVRDTATEVRKLRNKRVAVLGVFAGEEEDLQAEKKIFGKDFAYIRDISNFANVVGRYLKRQLLDV